MTDKQENRQSMYKATITTCDEHNSSWSAIPAFVFQFDKFKTINAELDAVKLIQVADKTGLAVDKGNKKINMTEKAVKVIGGLKAFALVTKNNELREKINYSHSVIITARDMDAISYCKIVYGVALEHAADMVDYGVADTDIAGLNNAIINFSSEVQNPRAAIAEKKAATSMLVPLFKDASAILRIMDGIVETLRESDPDFYNAYNSAREIIDLGHRKRKQKTNISGTVTSEESGKPLRSVNVTLIERLETVRTGSAGNYKLKTEYAGAGTLAFAHAGYITRIVTVNIAKGETITKDVRLVVVR